MSKRRQTLNPEKIRMGFGATILGLAFVGAGASQFRLQALEAGDTIGLAKKRHRYELLRVDSARRGRILSSRGKPLAEDQESFDLTVDFRKCPRSSAFWVALSSATRVPASEFELAAQTTAETRTWPQALSLSDITKLDELRSRWRADGVSGRKGGLRSYPLGEAAACLVGVVRSQGVVIALDTQDRLEKRKLAAILKRGIEPKDGKVVDDLKTGLEGAEDALLTGTDGESVGIADREGNLLPLRSSGMTKRRADGKDVTLTIDSELQTAAYEAIAETLKTSKAASASAVVLDPTNGDILALVNAPSFAPYDPDGSVGSMGATGGLNQTYMSLLEPGSMFKVLTLACALDAGVVHWGDHFYCPGEWKAFPKGKPIRCDLHNGTRVHGDLDPGTAIARSCNIWAAKWALGIGRPSFLGFLNKLGILEKPKLGELPTRAALFDQNAPAPLVQLARLGYGQSINVSPVALATAFAAIANGGLRVEPRLIRKVGTQEFPNAEGRRVLSEASCEKVLEGMKLVFEHERGTGRSLRIPGYLMGGKTGTAQALGREGGGHVSNFIGVLPAKKPRALILVMVDQPVGKYYGGDVAGPAYKKIAEAVIRRLEIQPDYAVVGSAKTSLKTKPVEGVIGSPEIQIDVDVRARRKAPKGA